MIITPTKAWPRRELLRRLGPAGFLFWPILRARRADAAAGAVRRLVTFHIPNGVHGPQFFPANAGMDFTGRFIEPLTPVKAKTTILREVSFSPLVDHEGLAKLFTNQKVLGDMEGRVAGPSVDWVVADLLQKGPHRTPVHSVQIGIDCYSPTSRNCAITYDGAGRRQAAETNPKTVFDRLFGAIDAACATAGTAAPGAAPTPAQLRQRSILGALRADVKAASARLGLSGAERAKLDGYESALRDIEMELGALQTAAINGCRSGDPKARARELEARLASGNMAQRGRLVADMIVLAFQLGITNVFSVSHFQEGARGPGSELRWFKYKNFQYDPGGAASSFSHHNLSHWGHKDDPAGNGKDPETTLEILFAVDRWCMDNLSHLAQRLEAEKTANGTMLDETLLFYLGSYGDGDRHTGGNVPCLVVGARAGGVPQGRNLALKATSAQVLTTITNLFGGERTSFGNAHPSAPVTLGLL